MDTRLINSQLVSRKDVRVWFWDGVREYRGDCIMIAENGIVFHAALNPKGNSTRVDVRATPAGVKKQLEGRKAEVELSSPRTKGLVKLRFLKIEPASEKDDTFAVTATFEATPDPRLLKELLEPVILRAPKKA